MTRLKWNVNAAFVCVLHFPSKGVVTFLWPIFAIHYINENVHKNVQHYANMCLESIEMLENERRRDGKIEWLQMNKKFNRF